MVRDETMRNVIVPAVGTALCGYVGYEIGEKVPLVPGLIGAGLGYYLTKPD